MCRKLQRQKVGDFGCGDGKIYKECPNQDIYSFDLVSKEDFITACDIAHVPLEDGFLDIGIFCLALMGTNWSEFIAESNRCLHEGGQLWVEVIMTMDRRLRKFVVVLRVSRLEANRALFGTLRN